MSLPFRSELLPEGVWLTTCDEMPGLVVETETREEGERLAPLLAAELAEMDGPVEVEG